MNERIKELAVKAKLEHCVSHVRLEDFAKQIIQDCLRLCKEVETELADIYEDQELEATQIGSRYYYEAILEKFGVEE